jgi:acetolactate synthase-1/2/3 large subunit
VQSNLNGVVSGSVAVLEAFLTEGVETIFGYPGGAIMPIYDALFDYQDRIKHIIVRHEQGAIHAAQGYARVSGNFGNRCFPGNRCDKYYNARY